MFRSASAKLAGTAASRSRALWLPRRRTSASVVTRRQSRRFARGAAAVVGSTAAVATICCTFPEQTHTQGLQRQAYFWSRLLPVVADYYWHFGQHSPRNWQPSNKDAETGNDDDSDFKTTRSKRQEELHAKHAPAVLQIMLDLKGLYIKLGQVLSVTALPIPQTYRQYFKTLQSDVPGHESFALVQDVLRRELQVDDLDTVFAYIDPEPCGAASIGQAHRAVLKRNHADDDNEQSTTPQQKDVILKVQYPAAAWQVPADIGCVGQLLQLCVWTGVMPQQAATLSFAEFARQFLAELDYEAELQNLQETYDSSLHPKSPYVRHGVVVPQPFAEFSSRRVICMEYLPGDKLETTALRQLQALGIDTSGGISRLVGRVARQSTQRQGLPAVNLASSAASLQREPPMWLSWLASVGQRIGQLMGVDNAFYALRISQQLLLWSTGLTARSMQWAAPVLPASWNAWSARRLQLQQQAVGLSQTKAWMDALMDVHGYQIFEQGLFNADCHPGNILVVPDETEDGHKKQQQRLGLIDYGQCKRLTASEQARVAQLVLSVARDESDERIANAFRKLGVKTQNDSTEFLSEMARLMFGLFETQHMQHAYHRRLHQLDRITYFPNELSMVYRCALLLRGLAVSLQINPSIAQHWKSHAQVAVDRHCAETSVTHEADMSKQQQQKHGQLVSSSTHRRRRQETENVSQAA